MQPVRLCRVFAAMVLAGMLVGCSRPDNPYARIQNPPLVRGTLHTVTVLTPDAGLAVRLENSTYSHQVFPSNYPDTWPVEAALWNVDEPTASNPAIFMSFLGHGPNVRLLFARTTPGPAGSVDEEVEAAFFRNVLGAEVPQWQGSEELRNGARVQAWTFLVDDVLVASKRLREAGIPVTVDPVAMTNAYHGDHKTMGIRGPGGIAIQLLQSAAQ